MENKEMSELLKILSEVVDKIQKMTEKDPRKSFVILARDTEFDSSLHFIASSGTGIELTKNVFGLLALSHEKEFIRDAMEMHREIFERKKGSSVTVVKSSTTDKSHLN